MKLPQWLVKPEDLGTLLRPPGRKMPDKFLPLAVYNAEVARGIEHAGGLKVRMLMLQREFDEWAK